MIAREPLFDRTSQEVSANATTPVSAILMLLTHQPVSAQASISVTHPTLRFHPRKNSRMVGSRLGLRIQQETGASFFWKTRFSDRMTYWSRIGSKTTELKLGRSGFSQNDNRASVIKTKQKKSLHKSSVISTLNQVNHRFLVQYRLRF
jgi:hypothetical protein